MQRRGEINRAAGGSARGRRAAGGAWDSQSGSGLQCVAILRAMSLEMYFRTVNS